MISRPFIDQKADGAYSLLDSHLKRLKWLVAGVIAGVVLIGGAIWWLRTPVEERPYPHVFAYRVSGTAARASIMFDILTTSYHYEAGSEIPDTRFETIRVGWQHWLFGVQPTFSLLLRADSLDAGTVECAILMDGKVLFHVKGQEKVVCLGSVSVTGTHFRGFQDDRWLDE